MASLTQTNFSTGTKFREIVAAGVIQKEGIFSDNLSKQLEILSSQLHEEQRRKIQTISVTDTIDTVTCKVIEKVVKAGEAVFEPAKIAPLQSLSPDVLIQLVGKPVARAEAVEKINNHLQDIAAMTYVSEVAQILLSTIFPGVSATTKYERVTKDTTAFDEVKQLVSTASLAASPTGAIYDVAGVQLPKIRWVDQAGLAIMTAGLLTANPGLAVIGAVIMAISDD